MYQIMRSRNRGLKDQMLDFAARLVRTESVSREEIDVANLIEQEMKELGYDRVIRDEAGNVIGFMFGTDNEPNMLLNCHMDTVGYNPRDKWNAYPYGGTTENGWLYGLGAADCKGGLAAQVYAGAILKNSLLPLKGNLVVAATVAEENGASIGVRHLIEKTLRDMEIEPTWAILGEPTRLGLYYGHDGWLELEIKVEGTNSFQVDDATNAIVNEFGRGGNALSAEGREFLELQEPVFENAHGARHATIRMERRLSPAEKVSTIIDEVEYRASVASQSMGAVAVAVGVHEETKTLYNGTTTMTKTITNAWDIDPFSELMTRARHCLQAAGCEARPGKWELGRLGMGTAGGVLVNDFNIPTIGYGPGDEEMAHAVNESVEVDKIVEASYGTAAITHGLIGVPVCGWTSDEI